MGVRKKLRAQCGRMNPLRAVTQLVINECRPFSVESLGYKTAVSDSHRVCCF